MYAVHPPQLTCITFRFVVNIFITCTVCDRVMTTAVKDALLSLIIAGLGHQDQARRRFHARDGSRGPRESEGERQRVRMTFAIRSQTQANEPRVPPNLLFGTFPRNSPVATQLTGRVRYYRVLSTL